MNSEDDFEQIAECLKALAHPMRIKILEELGKGSRCVNDLSEIIGLSQPNLSQHLGLLKNRGWVKRERKAVYVYYSLSEEGISKALREVSKIIRCFK
ncbi:MAG: metalloregulator ArsR/SmtB family transcription factor [Candidatus Aerophobetes bacterium]|nr:metalloregulator ArsR/SmtB family transcription factor [Candidatus Aerophobetes bacterium]